MKTASKKGDPKGVFLATARGQRPARRPMWIMRQAGRYLPEYREVRSRYSFLELCDTPAAAAEVTLQPIRRYDMDAAILFTDLLTPVAPMGIGLDYDPGPVLEFTVDTEARVDALKVPDPEADLGAMLETVRLVRDELDEGKALIGFVGAPFTLACYMVEGRGSKNWDGVRRLMLEQPELFDRLMDRIVAGLEPLVDALVHAGCDAIQTFDSWAGVLSAEDWATRCAPRSERLLLRAQDAGAVAIQFVNGAAQHFETMRASYADILAVDWRVPMSTLRAHAGPERVLQGNLDPAALFAPEAELRRRVRAICDGAGETHHVFNLGHGITPPTDPRALEIVVDEVRRS